MSEPTLKSVVEAALLAAGRPLNLDQILKLFEEEAQPERGEVREALQELGEDYAGRAIELREVASGYRLQIRETFSPWVSKLWEERPQRYSRALLETLALIAYRQPITRGEIEEIRGVAVSTNIMKTLQDRNWVRIVGHRDVPGRPAMFGTTREFLDYFGLKSLDELPTLAELRDIDSINVEMDFGDDGAVSANDSDTTDEAHNTPQEQTDDTAAQTSTDDAQAQADDPAGQDDSAPESGGQEAVGQALVDEESEPTAAEEAGTDDDRHAADPAGH